MHLHQHKGFVTLTIKHLLKLSRVHNVKLTPRSSTRTENIQKHMSTKVCEEVYTNVNVHPCVLIFPRSVYYPTRRG